MEEFLRNFFGEGIGGSGALRPPNLFSTCFVFIFVLYLLKQFLVVFSKFFQGVPRKTYKNCKSIQNLQNLQTNRVLMACSWVDNIYSVGSTAWGAIQIVEDVETHLHQKWNLEI